MRILFNHYRKMLSLSLAATLVTTVFAQSCTITLNEQTLSTLMDYAELWQGYL